MIAVTAVILLLLLLITVTASIFYGKTITVILPIGVLIYSGLISIAVLKYLHLHYPLADSMNGEIYLKKYSSMKEINSVMIFGLLR